MTATVSSDRALKRAKLIRWIALIATGTSLLMYASYIVQIRLNLSGQVGSAIQPAFAMMNSAFWIAYAALKDKTDWPIIVANGPGILFAGAAVATTIW